MSPTNLKFKIQNSKFTAQRGVSLYIAFMIMTILLGIAFGMNDLLFSQLGILKGMGHSVLAFYATEAGLERALYIDNTVCLEIEVGVSHAPCLNEQFGNIGAFSPGSVNLSNGASYQLKAESPGDPGCLDGFGYNYCVRVEGEYKEAKRAFRVAR